MRTQVTFDCADPHGQARFWPHVYGRAVESHSDRGLLTYVVRDPEGNEFCLH